MPTLAGVFLIAHGLLHIAVWVTPQPPDIPFDSHQSWLLGNRPLLSRAAAVLACLLLVAAGGLVAAGIDLGRPLAIGGAAVSLALLTLTFDRWFVAAVAIDIAIIGVAIV